VNGFAADRIGEDPVPAVVQAKRTNAATAVTRQFSSRQLPVGAEGETGGEATWCSHRCKATRARLPSMDSATALNIEIDEVDAAVGGGRRSFGALADIDEKFRLRRRWDDRPLRQGT
jgi:hypothetical protein